jgi:hypothetical protein
MVHLAANVAGPNAGMQVMFDSGPSNAKETAAFSFWSPWLTIHLFFLAISCFVMVQARAETQRRVLWYYTWGIGVFWANAMFHEDAFRSATKRPWTAAGVSSLSDVVFFFVSLVLNFYVATQGNLSPAGFKAAFAGTGMHVNRGRKGATTPHPVARIVAMLWALRWLAFAVSIAFKPADFRDAFGVAETEVKADPATTSTMMAWWAFAVAGAGCTIAGVATANDKNALEWLSKLGMLVLALQYFTTLEQTSAWEKRGADTSRLWFTTYSMIPMQLVLFWFTHIASAPSATASRASPRSKSPRKRS